MALVPYRPSGAAADQTCEERLFQLGRICLTIRQKPKLSNAFQHSQTSQPPPSEVELEGPSTPRAPPAATKPDLTNVGLVVWESGFVLTDYLLRHPPFKQWADVKVVDLGSGTGVVGIGLAAAGADVTLTDLPHITPLTLENVQLNIPGSMYRVQVKDLKWGPGDEYDQYSPDLITGGDLLYDGQHFDDLIYTIKALSAPHTLTYLCYKMRNKIELEFAPKAEAQGLHVAHIEPHHLHEDYRGGSYHIMKLCRLD